MNLAISECANKMPELLFNHQGIASHPVGRFLKDYLLMGRSLTLLETAKLHDPAETQGNENLSIDFFAKQSFWTDEKWKKIRKIKRKLNKFCGRYKIKKWRNKIFAHHDRKTFETHGEEPIQIIPPNKIDDYLTDLGQLAAEIWTKWDCGGS